MFTIFRTRIVTNTLMKQMKNGFHSTRIVRGLEEFFDSQKGWIWNEKESKVGRGWLASELRLKSFEDLHALWWVCVRHINKLESQKHEAKRYQMFFPHQAQIKSVKMTMARMKQVLWERRISYLQAQEILKQQSLPDDQQKLTVEEIKQVGRKQKRKIISGRGNRKPKDSRATSWTVV